MKWYVVHVMTGAEQDVQKKLSNLGVTALVPIGTLQERKDRRWVDTQRVLLPGYVFVETELAPRTYYTIRGVPGVMRFLGLSPGVPSSVPLQEMEPWLILGNNGQPLDIANGIRDLGGFTVITSGPLAKLSHQLTEVDARQRRAKLKLYIQDKTYEVTIGIKVTNKSSASDPADEQSPCETMHEQNGSKNQTVMEKTG